MSTSSYARVHRHPDPIKGRYWQAYFQAWDANQQRWKTISKSTRCTDQTKALEIAREFERVALAAGGPSGTVRLSREQIQAAIDDILRLAGHRPVVHSRTWQQHAAAWLEAQKKRIPKTLTLRTWQSYSGHLKNFNGWLGAELATMPLLGLTGEHLQRWYHDGLAGGLSPGTMNNTATTLSSVFQNAIDEGIATRNPVNLINRDDRAGNIRDAFTLEQMDCILAHLRKQRMQDWLTVALLGFCTSQRLEDCAHAVRTAFEKCQFGKLGQWWVWTLTQRKTGKVIRIPLVEPLASHIASLMRQPPSNILLAPSLARETSGGWKHSLSAQFAQILRDCSIKGRHIPGKGKGRGFNSLSFHSTRHTCNSLLAEAGVPADIRLLITGHGDKRTNIGYTHLADETKAKALQKAFKRTSTRKSA